jgi:hypothetical protein
VRSISSSSFILEMLSYRLQVISASAEEILAKLKEKFEDTSFIHLSFEELLAVECLDASVDLKASEILELIHTKKDYPECEASWCKYQRVKLKKKV